MPLWLLDTCVVSELSRSQPEPRVVEWMAEHGARSMLSAVSIGEIVYGIECMPAGARRNALLRWATDLRSHFANRVLASDELVWATYGRLKASLEAMGRPQDDRDILIGATATVRGLQVATRNTKHFKDLGVPLFNPWQPAN
jgi:predicted nucleic acid-binding protein